MVIGWYGNPSPTNYPFIYQTSTSSVNWSPVSLSSPPVISSSTGQTPVVACDGNVTCLALVTEPGIGSHTYVNLNQTVSDGADIPGFLPTSITCSVGTYCIAGGVDLGTNFILLDETTNSGTTWQSILPASYLFTVGSINAVSCNAGNYCIAVGSVYTGPVILERVSGVWQSASLPALNSSIQFVAASCDAQYCYAVGNGGGVTDPVIVQTLAPGSGDMWTVTTLNGTTVSGGIPSSVTFLGAGQYPANLFKTELSYFKSNGIDQYRY